MINPTDDTATFEEVAETKDEKGDSEEFPYIGAVATLSCGERVVKATESDPVSCDGVVLADCASSCGGTGVVADVDRSKRIDEAERDVICDGIAQKDEVVAELLGEATGRPAT